MTWNCRGILTELKATFSDGRLFKSQYVNDPQYLKMYQLHARVCGLLARVGIQNGYVAEFGRRFKIDPVLGKTNRYQHQAEADVSFVDRTNDTPIVLLDYETSDADRRIPRPDARR